MIRLNKRQINILENISKQVPIASSDILNILTEKASLVTIKRDLEYLVDLKYIERVGKGRSTTYIKTTLGILFCPVDVTEYNKEDPDKRTGFSDFNFSLFKDFPESIFFGQEKDILDKATESYKKKIESLTPVVESKELERFVIELSWKSSKIEGNTYTLLDTERLIREGIPAPGHTKDEASMILNHKKAFSFILDNLGRINGGNLDAYFVEKVHELLVVDLGVPKGVRQGLVGITGTKYKPLDNKYQITEALEDLYKAVNKSQDVYSKALLILLGISYIQPFEDGNKRAARLLANAVLLSFGCAPLSYRSVDEVNYRESILVFYEQNSILPMKDIFVEQYIFACENYLVG
jgi:Fic family protein